MNVLLRLKPNVVFRCHIQNASIWKLKCTSLWLTFNVTFNLEFHQAANLKLAKLAMIQKNISFERTTLNKATPSQCIETQSYAIVTAHFQNRGWKWHHPMYWHCGQGPCIRKRLLPSTWSTLGWLHFEKKRAGVHACRNPAKHIMSRS